MTDLPVDAVTDARAIDAAPGTARRLEAGDDSPDLARRLRLFAFSSAQALRAGPGPRHVTSHARVGSTALTEAVGIQRTMAWLRVVGLAVIVGELPFVGLPEPAPMLGAVGILLAVLGLQLAWLRSGREELVHRIGWIGLGGDSIAAYLLGGAFITTTGWVHFIAYPLLALEGAIVVGPTGALVSTVASWGAFLVQEQVRAAAGLPAGAGTTFVVVAIFGCFGAFSAAYAGLTRRMRGDLEALLEVSTLLSLQESPTRIVQVLDGRLRELVGARIRSVAVRRADGAYEVLRWRTPETRIISQASIRGLSAHVGHDIEREIGAGRAITILIKGSQDEPIAAALGLPDWVRAITLVPIAADGLLGGILPVLWDSLHVPSTAEMDLLNGLAQQTGLAFQQTQLRRARELAATDSLTGLANHRAFRDALAARVAEGRRHGGTFSILFCDLDRFKTVNDRHGHAVGDVLLHRIATAVREAARSEDLVARYGGDELALLLPGTGRFGALDLARRLRSDVLRVEDRSGVDMTIGIAVFPDDADDPDDLVARADAAMYAGKRLGGARVVMAAELPPEA